MLTGFETSLFGVFSAPAACIVLFLIYLWQSRARKKTVSALFLWLEPEAPSESGSKAKLRRFPWTFYVELIILLLLALGAAMPFYMNGRLMPPLVVVLDDSYSMNAKISDTETVKNAALKKVRKYVSSYPGRRIIWITAGSNVEIIKDSNTAFNPSGKWRVQSSSSNIGKAVSLGLSRAPNAEVLIVGDHTPEYKGSQNLSYISVGRPLENCAIVNARRTDDAILAEIENFSSQSVSGTLVMKPSNAASQVTLAPGERRKIVLAIPSEFRLADMEIRFDSANDALEFDNVRILLPEIKPPLSVSRDASIASETTRHLEPVFAKLPEYVLSSVKQSELVFGGAELPRGQYHRFIWHSQKGVVTGEKLSVRSDSPFTEGLNFDDVIWSAAPDTELPGEVLVRRGKTDLFSAVRRFDGYMDFHLNMDPARSDAYKNIVWPSLFWNIADSLHAERAGIPRSNYRSEDMIRLKVPIGDEKTQMPSSVSVVTPDGAVTEMNVVRGNVYITDLPQGITELKSGEDTYRVSITACSVAESDLSKCSSYEKMAKLQDSSFEYPRKSLLFPIVLIMLALLVIHQHLLGKSSAKQRGVS